MIQLTLVNTQQTHPQVSFDLRRLARFLLMRLNPMREGDILNMLGKPSQRSDMDCIIGWLIDNQHRFAHPVNENHCYEMLIEDIQLMLMP